MKSCIVFWKSLNVIHVHITKSMKNEENSKKVRKNFSNANEIIPIFDNF